TVENAAPYLVRERAHDVPNAAVPSPLLHVPTPVGDRGALHISTTPLATFESCPRRYRLVHELGLDPPPFGLAAEKTGDENREKRRALGVAAHRVLEMWPLARWGDATEPREVA